ncbi:MAG: DUF6528 family protein [Bacillota bacterium]
MNTLFVCGDSEVLEFDDGVLTTTRPKPLWRWNANQVAGAGVDQLFLNIDECKPVNDGQALLITSSWKGGMALVDRSSGETSFTIASDNAHSAAMLPDGRIVLASSEGTDLISLYDPSWGSAPLWTDRLKHAHGVVWDAEHELLWALGYEELRAYALTAWKTRNPCLSCTVSLTIPDEDGHDLMAVPGSSMLTVTTRSGVHLFDCRSFKFMVHPLLGVLSHVKSISVNPADGRIAFVQADTPNWWSEKIRFLNPSGALALPGRNLYKARWCVRE